MASFFQFRMNLIPVSHCNYTDIDLNHSTLYVYIWVNHVQLDETKNGCNKWAAKKSKRRFRLITVLQCECETWTFFLSRRAKNLLFGCENELVALLPPWNGSFISWPLQNHTANFEPIMYMFWVHMHTRFIIYFHHRFLSYIEMNKIYK